MGKRVGGVVGFWTDDHELVTAAKKIREAGFRKFDAVTPFPVHGIDRAMGFEGRDPARPQFTDHCFTGDYPTPLTDLAAQEASPRQLSLLAEAI